ncbi:exodeoxyribonuclease V subunit beta [Fodinibius sp. Rm-B-1B1-1]|uniref:exodeoxyribonuclease V subunit beta n=1 Tax=Fodinibius alkaliphilus TaxID=3140241 RepID=UPI00315A9208
MKELKPFDIAFSGINLVEASAGTGKTYNITSLYIRALIERDVSVSNILVVTYTEAATKELKDRLLSRIRESIAVLKKGEVDNENDQFLHELLTHTDDHKQAIARLNRAVRTFDESAIHTIHGFCYQVLQEQAFESRAMYDAEMIGDDSELVLEAVDDYWRNWVAEVSQNPAKKPLYNLLLNKGYNPEKFAVKVGQHIGKSYLDIIPSNVPSVSEIQHELNDLRSIFEQMQNNWKSDRDEILSLLLSDCMNGRKYRKDYLANWFSYMDEFLTSDFIDIQPFEQFTNFTQSVLEDNLNKGYDQIPAHSFFDLAEEYLSQLDSILQFEITFKKDLLHFLRNELDQKKEELQVLSYDDLLLRLRNALLDGEQGIHLADRLRQKYPIAMVDEFQDTDPNQYDIFRTVYKDSNGALFMIGDPKQSIYSFRGADVFSYLKAKRDAPAENTFDLGRNFRSVPTLIEGLNTLWGEHDNPFILDQIPYESVKPGKNREDYQSLVEYDNRYPPIRFRNLSLEDRDQFNKAEAKEMVAEDTAQEIERLIEGGKSKAIKIGKNSVEAKDIAVLVRTHDQASMMAEALRKRKIKSVQYSQESVFDSVEAGWVEILLKAVVEPANESRIKAALALPLTTFSAKEIYDIEEDEQRWLSVLEQFREWHQLWQEKSFSAMFRSLINKTNIAEHIIQHSEGERRLTNLLHLGELLQAESRNQKSGMRGLLKWLAKKRQEDNRQQWDEEQLRLESDEELVKIVTMHRSKGLEYPIVFCPFLWHGPKYSDYGKPLVYHDPDNLEKTYLDLHGKSDDDRNEKRLIIAKEELSESLRLAYVAMTRAEHCCYLSWAYAKRSEFSPLGYLFLEPEKVHDLLVETISTSYRGIGNEPFEDSLQQLCEEYPQYFTLEAPSAKPTIDKQTNLFDDNGKNEFLTKSFTRQTPLNTGYQVSSFSSLSSWMEEDDPDMPDYDQFMDYNDIQVDSGYKTEFRSIFTFPKGPQPGTCIHNIFENIDFANPEKEIIADHLQMQGIDEQWMPVVADMLETVLNKPLLPTDSKLTLSAIDEEKLIPEMEFYYQNSDIKTRKLLRIIRNENTPQWDNRGRAESGFLKGFIDLTFEFNGKFYLLDYKTNFLGDSIQDYSQEYLIDEMQEASYDLQYHIYTVALHRFLQKRLLNYSYQKHFGGAFYLFLRGMNDEGREGIYFDCPDEEVITKLDEYIRGGKHA